MNSQASSRVAAIMVLLLAQSVTKAHAALTCGQADTTGAYACYVDPAVDSAALCNDGSRPAFWIRPGNGAGAKSWVIWLEGGGQCTSRASCAARAKGAGAGYTTSAGFTARAGAGLLSSNPVTNPLLYSANVVLVHYCSSDDWSGGRTPTLAFNPADPTTWHFQGRRIALAAIASLHELRLGFRNAANIVLGGSSAGGLGVTVTANDILPTLHKSAAIRVVNDAGFAVEIGQYDPKIAAPYVFKGQPTAFTHLFEAGMALWSGRGDAKCDAAAHTPQARAACYSAQVFSKGYIGVPSFIAESQLDTAQLSDELCPGSDGNCAVPRDPRSMQGQYAAAFGHTVAGDLTSSGPLATWGVYSPDAYMHTMLTNSAQFNAKQSFSNGKLSPQAVLSLWMAGGKRRVLEIANSPGLAAQRP